MVERALEALKALGLTEQEAKAYLALVAHGELTAKEVSMLSGVPYSKIYGILERLRERGWISARPGRPKRYTALPPAEAVRTERLRREAELKALEACVIEELQPLYERSRAVERPDIWIIRGLDGVLSKVREVLSRAREEVLLAVPSAAEGLLGPIEPSIAHLRFSGIEVRILASEDLKEQLSALAGLAEVKFRSGMFGGGVIVDGREAVLILARSGRVMAIWSDYAELAHIAKVYFEHLWSGG
ncbi:TrmB family transcriptional regulator [Candidatus Bathyarchaeota archaeon]|nr:MAG: TrmB family transcriptional regulator [Candidatus Bathyarchaeota archaeon]